jgi:hypothetical protein
MITDKLPTEAIEASGLALAEEHDRLMHDGKPTAALAYKAGSVAVVYWNALAKVSMEAVRPPVGEEIWRVRCEHLLACIDSCNEAGSPPDEMNHEDIALIDETRTALAMQSNG